MIANEVLFEVRRYPTPRIQKGLQNCSLEDAMTLRYSIFGGIQPHCQAREGDSKRVTIHSRMVLLDQVVTNISYFAQPCLGRVAPSGPDKA